LDIFILVANSDGIRFEGVRNCFKTTEPIYFKPFRAFEYQQTPQAVNHEYQTYIQICADRKKIIINTSPFGEYPLFFFQNRSQLFISSSLERVCQKAVEAEDGPLIDRVAILESMIFDYPLRQRTILANVSKAMPGKCYSFDLINGVYKLENHFIIPFDKGEPGADEACLLDQATEVLSSLPLNNLTNNDGDVLLPLSGGLDSRLLACLLKRDGVNFNAITFGPPESTERIIAQKVAKNLNIPLRILNLATEYYRTYGSKVTALTGGLANHRHCHLFSILTANGIKSDNIIHGYLGGEYAGAAQPDFATSYKMSKNEALDQFLNQHVRSHRIWSMISQMDSDEIISDLEKIMHECCKVNLPCHFDEYVHNVERQFSLISNIFIISEHFGHFIRPFASQKYAVFFNSLPFKYRRGRYLFRKAALNLFPRSFTIGTQSQIFPENSLNGKFEMLLSRMFSGLSFASFLLTKGQLVIPNPKGYEHHRQALFGNLKTAFLNGIGEMNKLLGVDLTPFQQISFKNKDELSSQYRILSNSIEIKCLRNKTQSTQNNIHSDSSFL